MVLGFDPWPSDSEEEDIPPQCSRSRSPVLRAHALAVLQAEVEAPAAEAEASVAEPSAGASVVASPLRPSKEDDTYDTLMALFDCPPDSDRESDSQDSQDTEQEREREEQECRRIALLWQREQEERARGQRQLREQRQFVPSGWGPKSNWRLSSNV